MEKQGYLYSSLIRFHGVLFSKYHMEVKSAYTMRHHDVLCCLEKTHFRCPIPSKCIPIEEFNEAMVESQKSFVSTMFPCFHDL